MNDQPAQNLLLAAIHRISNEIDAELAVIPKHASPDQLLDTKKTAALLDMSSRTLEAWRSEGTGPPHIKFNGLVRYRYGCLVEWILSEDNRIG